MDYKLGFKVLKEYLANTNPESRTELETLADRFHKNDHEERIFGTSENVRNERARIIYALNDLALKHCGVSFNDLCRGIQPAKPAKPDSMPSSSISRQDQHLNEPLNIPLELLEQLQKGNGGLFIGADLPHSITSLPSRANLASDLARRKRLDETLSLGEVAQRVSQAGNRWEFTDFIRNALDTTGKSPQPFHQQIATLVKEYRIETIITTAYDNLLELAFQQADVGLNRVVRGSDVNFINPDRHILIKLYGDAQQSDTLVVTDQDHSALLRDRDKEALIDTVRYAFRRNTMLFLGYNLADPDFRFLFDQVAESKFARIAYAVWSGLPEVDVRMWRDRGIVILDRDPLTLLDRLTGSASADTGISLPEQSSSTPALLVDSLMDALEIYPEHDGQPYSPRTGHQWFSRLRIESKKALVELTGKVYDIRRLNGPDDQQGISLREFRPSILSWDREKGLFAPISVQAAEVICLDLAWRADHDPPIPPDELRVASALDEGPRDTTHPEWGMRQDFIPLKPGYYRFVVRIEAKGYNPLDLPYLLYWPGPGQEDNIRLTEIPLLYSQPEKKEDDEASGIEPLYGNSQRWAVLVGVNEYEDRISYGQLQVCVKDVNALREHLIIGGFDPARLRLLTDETDERPTRNKIMAALQSVANSTEPNDLLLFYYSGHGDEANSESYLVARDGERVALRDTAVPIMRIKEIMEKAPARAKVIILDACHSGANIGSKGPQPMSAEFIRHVFEQAEGLAILASCKQGQLSYEWRKQERSVFTHYLLEALAGQADRDEKGFVTVQDANRHVVNGVKVWAAQHNISQTPTLQYTVAGDIILSRLAKPS